MASTNTHEGHGGGEPDNALVVRAVGGSADAYSILVGRYYGQVYAIAYSHLQSREAAEELAQDVFIRGYLYIGKLTDPQRFAPWVCRIARNLSLNWVRDQRRRSEVIRMIPLDGLPEDPPDTAPSPREAASSAQMEQWLDDAITTLPPELREAVLLHYFESVSKAQIAELQGVNASTLGRRIDAAIMQLQQKFAGNALVQLKAQWKPARAAKGAAALAAAVSSLPHSTHAALLATTADTLTLGALPGTTAAAAATTTSTIKAGAGAMITKTGMAVVATSLVVVGVIAFPKLNLKTAAPKQAQSTTELSEARRRSVASSHFASNRESEAARRIPTNRTARATTSSASGSTTTLAVADVEESPLDSGTQTVDPSAITTVSVNLTVLNEARQPIAGARVSSGGARVAHDLRTWAWDASGTTGENGQTSLTVPQLIDDLEVRELLFTARHVSYQPTWLTKVPFSLTPELIMKEDKNSKHILRVHVKDEAGQPVQGVTVQGQGLRESKTPSTGYGWIGVAYKGMTDAEGIAAVPYPARITSVNQDVTTVILGLFHPAFTNESKEFAVDPPDQEVRLRRGAELVVSGYNGDPQALVTGLKVKIDEDAGAGTPWDDASGDQSTWEQLDSTHLYNRKINPGTRALYAWAEVQGSTYYSDITPVTLAKGERKDLNLELKPSIHVRGKLSDNVPRPVVNGELQWEMPNTQVKGGPEDWGPHGQIQRALNLSHGGKASIQPDGTFDLGRQPAGKIEIAAMCNGWRNKDGLTLREYPMNRSVLPQVFDITPDTKELVLEMEATAGFKATVVKPNGEPLPGATLYFTPNVFFLNYANIFIRKSGYSGTTDAAGNVHIADIPHGTQHLAVGVPGNEWQLPDDLRKGRGKVILEPGKVTQMEIKLAPATPDSVGTPE